MRAAQHVPTWSRVRSSEYFPRLPSFLPFRLTPGTIRPEIRPGAGFSADGGGAVSSSHASDTPPPPVPPLFVGSALLEMPDLHKERTEVRGEDEGTKKESILLHAKRRRQLSPRQRTCGAQVCVVVPPHPARSGWLAFPVDVTGFIFRSPRAVLGAVSFAAWGTTPPCCGDRMLGGSRRPRKRIRYPPSSPRRSPAWRCRRFGGGGWDGPNVDGEENNAARRMSAPRRARG